MDTKSRRARLDEAEISEFLKTNPLWQGSPDGKSLQRSFRFNDFDEAFAFITRIALWAATNDHHPNWTNSYNRLDISLSTHECGGISLLDCDLARFIDRL